MKSKTMLLLTENSHELKEVTLTRYHDISSELTEIYRFLNCRTIDCTTTKIGTRIYDVICDDEGLLKDNVIFTLFEGEEPRISGNMLLTQYNIEGENIGLSQEDINYIRKHKIECAYTTIRHQDKYIKAISFVKRD